MIVDSSLVADDIVKKNPRLSWDGWTIVYMTQDDYAEFLSVGFFNREDGKWYRRELFPLTEFGWELPDSVVENEK